MRLVYRPIETWPGEPTKQRKDSPFSASWTDTQETLERELRALDVTEAVLQVASPNERDFRLDGALRADARLRSPAVILSFEHRKHGKLSYPCDTFDKSAWRRGAMEGWQVNVRAIALGLEALRKVDRYGIANTGQQYTGWKAIGSGAIAVGPKMTVEDAARFLTLHARTVGILMQDVRDHPHVREEAYRAAAKRLHPDVGGNGDDFRRLTEAYELLKANLGR